MKYKDYKNFTPCRCKACDSIIDEDIHDSLCLRCLEEIFDVELNEDDYRLLEGFVEDFV